MQSKSGRMSGRGSHGVQRGNRSGGKRTMREGETREGKRRGNTREHIINTCNRAPSGDSGKLTLPSAL